MKRNIIGLMASVALIAMVAGQGMAQAVVEDGTVWAGGDPNFDESAGGGVIEVPMSEEVPVGEPEPVTLVDPIEGMDEGTVDESVIDGGEDCVACFNIGDGDGSEGSPIVADDGAEPARGGITELGGASPEVLRGNIGGLSPAKVQAQSNSSEDNADCIARVGRAQAHRCMN